MQFSSGSKSTAYILDIPHLEIDITIDFQRASHGGGILTTT
jgi:hypothetical protein